MFVIVSSLLKPSSIKDAYSTKNSQSCFLFIFERQNAELGLTMILSNNLSLSISMASILSGS